MSSNQRELLSRSDAPKLFEIFELDLSVARTRVPFSIQGYGIIVPNVIDTGTGNLDFTAKFEVFFTERNDAVGLQHFRSSESIVEFNKFFITNTAQAAKRATVVVVTAPEGFKYLDNLSAGISTITTVNTVDSVTDIKANGPMFVNSKLGANATIVFFDGSASGGGTTTLYTCPSGKKAWVLRWNVSCYADDCTTFDFRGNLDGDRVFSLVAGVAGTAIGVQDAYAIDLPLIGDKPHLTATELLTISSTASAATHGMNATGYVLQCDV